MTVQAGDGKSLPNQSASGQAPGLWGSGFSLVASAVVFLSLIFAYYFLWMVSTSPLPPVAPEGAAALASFLLLLPIAATFILWRATAANRGGAYRRFRWGLAVTFALGAIYPPLALATVSEAFSGSAGSAYLSLVSALYGYLVFHLFIALLAIGFCLVRSRRGFVDARRTLEIDVATMLWSYAAVVAIVVHGVVHLSPILL